MKYKYSLEELSTRILSGLIEAEQLLNNFPKAHLYHSGVEEDYRIFFLDCSGDLPLLFMQVGRDLFVSLQIDELSLTGDLVVEVHISNSHTVSLTKDYGQVSLEQYKRISTALRF